MKKQVNILERDEKEASEFLSPLWVSGLDIQPICLTSDTEEFLSVCVSLSTFLSLSLCILTVKIISLYSVLFYPSQQSALLPHMQTSRNKPTHTHLRFDTSQTEQLWSIHASVSHHNWLVQTRHCLIGSVPITVNIKQWAHLALSLPADAYKCSHHRFPFFTHLLPACILHCLVNPAFVIISIEL